MNEADRIRAMRDEGKIDDAQATRLLAAVEAITAAERAESDAQQSTGAHAAAGATPSTASSSTPPPPVPPTPAASHDAGSADATGTVPEADLTGVVDRWLALDLFAGSLDVKVDPTATAPSATSSGADVTVETTADGWAIAQSRDEGGTWLERLVSGVKESNVHVTVPPRTGVRLNVKAGDIELDGIPALHGRLMAGDLDANGLRAVDLNVKAGDIDLEIDPLPGRHSVFLAAGDLTVQLPEHADASVHGSVKVGDASAFAPLVSERRGMIAGDVRGVLGQGRARIELTVGTGDLDVERSHPRGS